MEIDTEQNAVINTTHEHFDIKLHPKCVFAFLGDYIEEYARKNHVRQVANFISETKDYPIYIAEYKGEWINKIMYGK